MRDMAASSNLAKEMDQSEKLYRQSHHQLYTLLENTEDCIMIADAQGFPQVFNSAYAQIMKKVLGLEMKPGIKPHKLLDNQQDILTVS